MEPRDPPRQAYHPRQPIYSIKWKRELL
jgi:hypothetical protein